MTHTHVRALVATAIATMLALTACTSTDPSTITDPTTTTTRAAAVPDTTELQDTEQNPPADTTPTDSADGPVDGPIVDPCAVTWAAFPAAVRPTGETGPGTPAEPRPGEQYERGCLFLNNTHPGYDPAKPARDGDFAARLTWGTGLNEAKISQGAQPKTWNGQDGGLRPYGTPTGVSCLAYATSGTGHAVVQVRNKRFATIDACTVADTLMTALTTPTN